MRAMCPILLSLALAALFLSGCARHTYYVQLNDGKKFYADPPLVLNTNKRVYYMWTGGKRYVIPMDSVYNIDDADQVCYSEGFDDMYTCIDGLYQF